MTDAKKIEKFDFIQLTIFLFDNKKNGIESEAEIVKLIK